MPLRGSEEGFYRGQGFHIGASINTENKVPLRVLREHLVLTTRGYYKKILQQSSEGMRFQAIVQV